MRQPHTARRIWQRLCAELPGFTGSERTVRAYVHRQGRLSVVGAHEVSVPQSYDWGVEAQVTDTARHGSNRQHSPTLTLFENQLQ
jgi:hypothetical protein